MSVEPNPNNGMDQDACYEIRKLLKAHGVPSAAFIDDHVANAIAQRNILANALMEARVGIQHDKAVLVDEALKKAYPSGIELRAIGDAVARHITVLHQPPAPTCDDRSVGTEATWKAGEEAHLARGRK